MLPAYNGRIAGWTLIREYLQLSLETGTQESRLQIAENCKNLIRTMPLMLHDETQVEDIDTTGEDHAVDALRYGLMFLAKNKGGGLRNANAGATPKNTNTAKDDRLIAGTKPKNKDSKGSILSASF